MAFNVNTFRSNMQFDGARPTLFKISIVTPNSLGLSDGGGPLNTTQLESTTSINNDLDFEFKVRAGSIPESQIGVVRVPYFGRTIQLAGDRVFNPWTVTVIVDEDFTIRNTLEAWSNRINRHILNTRDRDMLSPAATDLATGYKKTAIVTQYSKVGDILRQYKFDGIFPQLISPIDLDWGATDTVEEFQCTFEYDWWELLPSSVTGDAGGFPTRSAESE